jgi:hypothetical protein
MKRLPAYDWAGRPAVKGAIERQARKPIFGVSCELGVIWTGAGVACFGCTFSCAELEPFLLFQRTFEDGAL